MLRINNVTELQRNEIIQNIFNRDVSVNVHFKPIPLLTFYKNLGYDIKNYPVAYDNYAREISLPIYPQLTDNEVDYICTAILTSYLKVIQND